jgi:hypothetical protein
MRDPGLWPLRVVWLLLPLVGGPALAHLLDDRSRAVGWVASVLVYGGWTVGLVAALVPHPLGLTTLRVLAPAGVAVAVASGLRAGAEVGPTVAALAGGLVAVSVVANPFTIDALVDGGSYGPERRWALRAPAGLQLGPVPLARAAVVVGLAAGPLLLAAGQWWAGVAALAAGVPLAAAAARALHGLAQRSVIFVPGGLVLHDRAVLTEPVLLPRGAITAIGPAEAGTAATDLTAGAAGLVVEVRLRDAVPASRRRGRREAERVELRAVLISPLRPGALLRAAAERRLPVG